MILIPKLPRRKLLRGLMGGAAVAVALPFLDCFLDSGGAALAATGAPLPVRFGTWFWGCGFTPGRWVPAKVGADYDVPAELRALAPFKRKLNVYSGMRAYLDGQAAQPHYAGHMAVFTGAIPRERPTLPSIDSVIGDVIGTRTRFRSLEVACKGKASDSLSRRSGAIINPAEIPPLALYTRLFGPEFKDPNAADFTPDTRVMVKRSVLSAITEQRESILKDVGAADRARLDEYFTSLRTLEQQLDLELEKPAPLAACSVPASPGETQSSDEVGVVQATHKLFAGLLAHALACDQTRVINVLFSEGASSLRKPGDSSSHHIFTHEEPIDGTLGYQAQAAWFVEQIMDSFAEMLAALDGIKEGDATLLDRTLLMASSDCSFAKMHTLENMPVLTAGAAGGHVKAGLHINAEGDPVTRVGLTMQQAFGVPVKDWGVESNHATKTITEVMA